MNSARINNFDLIRLVAALQVLVYHGLTHFSLNSIYQEKIKAVISYFPGVPIFFTISGFLIYKSIERNNHDLKRYFKNRLIRIFPALFVCLVFTIVLLFLSKELTVSDFFSSSFWIWILAQLSIFQFYKMPSLASWGVGHPNGSLWSISVELQYYFFLPLLFLSVFRWRRTKLIQNLTFIVLGLLSVVYASFQKTVIIESEIAGNIMGVMLFNYLYFFCIGILIYINFEFLSKFLKNKGLLWLGLFITYMLVFRNWLGLFDNIYEVSVYGVAGATLLALATISLTYTLPSLSNKLLRGNDISYGIYIYHMPIFNYLIHQQREISWQKLFLICAIVICVAYLSWRFIEKKMLQFKL
ncbi:acyltransferase family protein [Arcticibacterium luteifluviistationis]|uniref:Acyltransferase n=1 Tax=Arcticibacterium luteifluviistationis TaxID=1784714 RepID=A0A2Z4GBN5_9BACT|nr:acyltransferase [Arcticibacterium luteifluviistationis]AWV98607.1 acyltransferase [Arcticibacterium luteifluviistationis]